MTFFNAALTGFLLLHFAVPASAQFFKSRCAEVLETQRQQEIDAALTPELREWLTWEISPTLSDWAQERPQSPLPVTEVSSDLVRIESVPKKYLEGLDDVFSKSTLPWLKHPYNIDPSVPFTSKRANDKLIALHTASRTVVTFLNGRLYAVKMPTNFPFGLTKDEQEGKVNLHADLKYSVARSQAIIEIDEKIGMDPQIMIQKELLAVIEKESGNGFLLRDLSLLRDGSSYLPGHQLPYVGKTIAQKNNSTVPVYWQKHWAEVMGRYQARLLYRYGMEVRAVNPQNFLIQLRQSETPTGALVWRDLAESHLIDQVARAIGLTHYVERDNSHGKWGVHQRVQIDAGNLSWRFNGTNLTISPDETIAWATAHDQAYAAELEAALDWKVPEGMNLRNAINAELGKTDDHSTLIQKIKAWHLDRQQKFQKRTPDSTLHPEAA